MQAPPTPSALYIAYNLLAIVLLALLGFAIFDLFKSKSDNNKGTTSRRPSGGGIRRIPTRRASTIGFPILEERRGITNRRASVVPRLAEEPALTTLNADWADRMRSATPAASRRNSTIETPPNAAFFRPRSRSVAVEAFPEDIGDRQPCRRVSTSCFCSPVIANNQAAGISEDGGSDAKFAARRIRVLRHR